MPVCFLLGRPGAAGTSPAGACPCSLWARSWRLLPSVRMPHPGTSLTPPRRPGHCLRLETGVLDPGSRQRHWQPPGSCAVSCDVGEVLRWGPNWRRWGGAQEAGGPSPASTPLPFLSLPLLRALSGPCFPLPASASPIAPSAPLLPHSSWFYWVCVCACSIASTLYDQHGL